MFEIPKVITIGFILAEDHLTTVAKHVTPQGKKAFPHLFANKGNTFQNSFTPIRKITIPSLEIQE